MKEFFRTIREKRNSGVSMIELIIVVTIMSVTIGAASLGIGMVANKPAEQCANNMEICLNRCRTHTMGKLGGYVAFYTGSDGAVYMVEKLGRPLNYDVTDSSDCGAANYTQKKIGRKGVKVVCAGTDITSSPGSAVFFEFNRSDGSLRTPAGGDAVIEVSKGNRKYSITIQRLTGKVILKRVD